MAQEVALPTNPTEKFVTQRASNLCRVHALPSTLDDWQKQKLKLINELEQNAGIFDNSKIPLRLKIHGEQHLDGYKVQNITFQVRKGMLATANLFIPDGEGPFPAVVSLHGHTSNGRFDADVQYRTHKLAKNGFVALSIDTWGSGERTTEHGVFEYHGGNLGANLLNIGETLLGAQVMDNRRAIDLLFSLNFVDKNNIGVTGESGGGNQTMWIMALDSRLKAAIPVVSVGTFEAYALGHNCICELLPKGMTLTDESGVISLIAPRAVRMYSAKQEANAAFMPSEMMKTFTKAKPIFDFYQTPQHISYQLFDSPHRYSPEMADSMVVWFSQVLKNAPQPSILEVNSPIDTLIIDKQWVFEKGKRPVQVKSIGAYCQEKSGTLKNKVSSHPKEKLREIFWLKNNPALSEIDFGKIDVWQSIKMKDGHDLPLIINQNGSPAEIILQLKNNSEYVTSTKENTLLVRIGLFGKSEQSSSMLEKYDNDVAELHTLARSNLWANETSIGIWYSEIAAVIESLKRMYPSVPISITVEKEMAIAAFLVSINEPSIKNIVAKDSPLSFVFDSKSIGFDKGFMAVHVPSVLKWGDVSDIVALSPANILFSDSRAFSGRMLQATEREVLKKEFLGKRKNLNNVSTLTFD